MITLFGGESRFFEQTALFGDFLGKATHEATRTLVVVICLYISIKGHIK
jgi:hypothetical protein